MQTDPQRLLRPKEAAQWLGLSPKTLEAMRRRGNGPLFSRIGDRCVRYSVKELEAYAFSRKVASTSEYHLLEET